jgi:hypothetical protein
MGIRSFEILAAEGVGRLLVQKRLAEKDRAEFYLAKGRPGHAGLSASVVQRGLVLAASVVRLLNTSKFDPLGGFVCDQCGGGRVQIWETQSQMARALLRRSGGRVLVRSPSGAERVSDRNKSR